MTGHPFPSGIHLQHATEPAFRKIHQTGGAYLLDENRPFRAGRHIVMVR